MNAVLDEWQKKLEAHFSSLAKVRQSAGLPVFAIEHSLDKATFQNISAGLHRRLVRGESLSAHWLLWVVYAAELGYEYDGEYWPSFEKRTPFWRSDIEHRRQLRQWFVKFHSSYVGVKPSGSWATQFSIIAWPITHAILPKDLQKHLARILYQQRYAIADVIDASPVQVGHLVAACAYDSSSRLRNFLEQEELAGRIVLSLLEPNQKIASASILDGTIRRIVSDLETTRDARTWLKEARSTVSSVRVRLAAQSIRLSHPDYTDPDSQAEEEGSRGMTVRPRIRLNRHASNSWDAMLEVPSFSAVAALSARLATFLRTTRCMLSGTGTTWSSRGWLLFGTQRKRLLFWPDSSKPVIRFEQWDEGMFRMLQGDCRISPGPIWLFQVHSDGTASEVMGRHVHPGHEYILLHKGTIAHHPLLSASGISCEGVFAATLTIPHDASESVMHSLATLGLRLERTLRIWPAGLPALHWDGEGHLEWLTGEDLCIGLTHDSSCEQIVIQLDGHKETKTFALQAAQTTFLSLGQLSRGSHSLSVTATYRNFGTERGVSRTNAKAALTIYVRPPNRWVPGTSGHAGLVVTTDPHEPTLDGLLGGDTRVAIEGPEGCVVSCGVELLDATGNVLVCEPLGDLRIPMTNADWASIVEERTQRSSDPSNYLRASGGRLVLDAKELGCIKIALRHSVVPIRWLAKIGKSIELALVDDSAHEELVKIKVASFREPASPADLVPEDLAKPIKPTGNGGLFLAVAGTHRAGLVVSVPGRGGLQDLADRPRLDSTLRDGDAVAALLGLLRDWSNARVVGPLAAQRRSIAVRAMEDQLFATMCGSAWIRAEVRYRDRGPEVSNARQWLENAVDQPVSFALSLSQTGDGALSESIEDSAQSMLALAIRFHVCGDLKVCEAALRLCATPEKFVDWGGGRVVKMLDELVKLKPLLRGARMLALLGGDDGRRTVAGWPT